MKNQNYHEKIWKEVKPFIESIETVMDLLKLRATDNEKEYLNLPELHSLNDIDRSLLACEGRSYIGKWLYLKPL